MAQRSSVRQGSAVRPARQTGMSKIRTGPKTIDRASATSLPSDIRAGCSSPVQPHDGRRRRAGLRRLAVRRRDGCRGRAVDPRLRRAEARLRQEPPCAPRLSRRDRRALGRCAGRRRPPFDPPKLDAAGAEAALRLQLRLHRLHAAAEGLDQFRSRPALRQQRIHLAECHVRGPHRGRCRQGDDEARRSISAWRRWAIRSSR